MPWSFTRPEFLQAAAAAGPMSPKGDDPHVSSGKCGNAAGPFTLVEPWRAVTGCDGLWRAVTGCDGLWLGAKGNYTLENSLVSGIQRRMSSLA